jgi:hypothetical protein
VIHEPPVDLESEVADVDHVIASIMSAIDERQRSLPPRVVDMIEHLIRHPEPPANEEELRVLIGLLESQPVSTEREVKVAGELRRLVELRRPPTPRELEAMHEELDRDPPRRPRRDSRR